MFQTRCSEYRVFLLTWKYIFYSRQEKFTKKITSKKKMEKKKKIHSCNSDRTKAQKAETNRDAGQPVSNYYVALKMG